MTSQLAPLSFAQQRLWFLDQLVPGTALYNVPLVLDLEGPLDPGTLEGALEEIIRRHEPLRTIFLSDDGRPYQEVLGAGPLGLSLEDLSELPAVERDESLERRIIEECRRPFDLSRGPVFHAVLVRLEPLRHVLIAAVHHIAFDAWSSGIFLRELTALYGAFANGESSPLKDVPTRYADFAVQQRAWLASDAFAAQLAYWREHLRPPLPLLALPTDRPRPAVQSFRGQRDRVVLSDDLLSALRDIGRRDGATLFMTLLAAYAMWLHRCTGQVDLLIGVPIANRTRHDLESLIGFFVNTLPLRLDLSGGPSFRGLLEQAKRVALAGYGRQNVPFERIVEELNPERSLSQSPILQTCLVFDNTPSAGTDHVAPGGLTIRRRQVATATSKFDLTLSIRRDETRRFAVLESSADLFDEATSARMLREFCALLEDIVEDADRSIDRVPPLSETERHRVLVEWNQTARAYPPEATLVSLFEEQVTRTPGRDALICGHEHLSYALLDRRANKLALELRALGIGPDDRVAICLKRSPDLVVGLLGVLKAGGAYIPLDPEYPEERLAFIARDARCRAMVTDSTVAPSWFPGPGPVIYLDRPRQENDQRAVPEVARVRPEDLAYVIYTSGSTGQPKGVAIEHRSAANLVAWALETFSSDELAGMLASTSISFDLSVFELFVPLSAGGTVVLVDNLFALHSAPAASRITFVNTVPSVIAEFLRLDDLPSGVKVAVLAGERLHTNLVERVYRQSSVEKVFDLYGPTETTVYATCALRSPNGVAAIGRPIANMRAIVLDPVGQLVPVGMAGELHLGGTGLARGYLGRPDLTDERFVADPFDGPSGRLYRTGDQVRWLPDGALEFLGRLDRQVKLRGFRIELGEIESVLGEHPALRDAVVMVREDTPNEMRLVAYVTQNEPCTNDALYEHLEAHLPSHMMPAAFVRLDELPRLPNGKLDRDALPSPEAPVSGNTLVLPRTATEEAIANVWRDLINVSALGVHDNFFRLGGHSLLATQVASRLRRVFGVPVELESIFKAPTIAEQACLFDAVASAASMAVDRPGDPAPDAATAVRAWSADMRELLLNEWAGEVKPYPRDSTIAQLFEQQAARTPDAPALVGADEELTYAQLNGRANRLARYLQLRIEEGDLVGLCLERSADTVLSLLAILKAGGAYVPLDPSHPPARLVALIERAKLRLVVTRAGLVERLAAAAVPMVCVDGDREQLAQHPASNLALPATAESLAYVMFTSGTTGEPKAVGVPHRAVARLVFGVPHVRLGEGQTVLHLAPLSFDASTFEIWGPLIQGGRLAVAPDGFFTSDALEVVLRSYGVTVLWLTASLFNAIIDDRPQSLASVTYLLTGGEALSVPHVERALLALPATHIINGYGPTESTTFACCHLIERQAVSGAESIPIGRPIANTRVYVLNPDRQLTPIGEPGELWIGGDGLARGYLDDESLTESRFVRDPFVDDPHARMYRTGDRVRFLADGVLEFLGRFDHQIKLRGFRIEPGEIEAALMQHPRVARAAVTVADRPPTSHSLIAYLVPAAPEAAIAGGAALPAELRDFLRQRLPDYMVPAQFIALESLPLLPTGKIDRRALAALGTPEEVRPRRAVVAPRSRTEAVIADIWRTVLGKADIDVEQTFFEHGGHSLLAAMVVSRIQKAFDCRIDLRALFASPSVAGLARVVDGAATSVPSVIPRASRDRDLPLSFAQQRLWFLQQWDPESGLYNVPIRLKLEGELDLAALEQALRAIVLRHEALRTVFPSVRGDAVQQIQHRADLVLHVTDLSDLPPADAEAAAKTLARDEGRRPFDLAEGPLVRASVWRLAVTTHVLLVTAHHMVMDGWSLGVLFRELEVLYTAARDGEESPLPPLTTQYPDFAVWQRQSLSGERLQDQFEYWRRQLKAPRQVLDMPLDRPRPLALGTRGGRVEFLLPRELTSALEAFSRSENATLFMTLLAAFQVLLGKYSDTDDVLVGTPSANRNRTDIEDLIGMFVNTLVLRSDISDDPTFRSLVQRVRQTTLDAQVNQDLPFELLVEELHVQRSMNHTPLFQTMFSLQNAPSRSLQLPGVSSASHMRMESGYAKFELLLGMTVDSPGIRGGFEYNAELFDRATAERLAAHYRILLEAAMADPDSQISRLSLVNADERRQLGAWAHGSLRHSGDPTLKALVGGTRARVIDRHGQLTPIGVPGELWIDEGATGVRARFLRDGTLESLGRVDERRALLSQGDTPDRSTQIRATAIEGRSRGPRDLVETGLVDIWRRILSVQDVGVEDNFFDLGGTSLLAVRLFGEIRDRFGVKLPLSVLFASGTIAGLARELSGSLNTDAWSPVVELQPHGTRPPFFLVHGIGGEVLSFRALARHIGTDQPIYGLRADTSTVTAVPASVEAMAAHYLRGMRAMVPFGPYRLGGYSYGGVVAYEMAQQLHAAGERVALLAMLDSAAPGPRRGHRMTLGVARRLLKNAVYWPLDDGFFRSTRSDQLSRLRSKFNVLRSRRAASMGRASTVDVRDLLGVWRYPAESRAYLEAYRRILGAYRPRDYPGMVTVLRSRTMSLTFRGTPALGWERLARGGIALHVIPGAHDTILEEPRVRKLAAALEASLLESAR